jgi:hypothetical protein
VFRRSGAEFDILQERCCNCLIRYFSVFLIVLVYSVFLNFFSLSHVITFFQNLTAHEMMGYCQVSGEYVGLYVWGGIEKYQDWIICRAKRIAQGHCCNKRVLICGCMSRQFYSSSNPLSAFKITVFVTCRRYMRIQNNVHDFSFGRWTYQLMRTTLGDGTLVNFI